MEPTPNPPQYVLQEPLGSGTYATVYRAYSRALTTTHMTRDTVAIKCMKNDTFRKCKVAEENLLLEIAILRDLRHKHIVQLKDFQWDSNFVYMIMEYCAGGDLSKYLTRHVRLDERVTRRFLQQLASALQYLRSRNVSHMDLKPKNILIDNRVPPYTLKLADFGFAMILSDNERTESKRGSPLYMAPEMLLKRAYDARVDLWSLGIILFECLFGHPPFRARNISDLERQIVSTEAIEFPSEPRLSVECFDLISLLLIRDPNHRITFQAFFEHEFVDLEHAPSEESMTKGVSLAKEAIAADRSGQSERAIKLYCDAIDYFVPNLSVIKSSEERANLRQKITNYVRRAEALKHGAKPKSTSKDGRNSTNFGPSPSTVRVRVDRPSTSYGRSPPSSLGGPGHPAGHVSPAPPQYEIGFKAVVNDSQPLSYGKGVTPPGSLTGEGRPAGSLPPGSLTNEAYVRENSLVGMWADVPQVKAAFTVVQGANSLVSQERWEEALAKYTLALESMLTVLGTWTGSTEPRVECLRRETGKWMRQAEMIKTYLSSKPPSVSAVEQRIIDEDFVQETTNCKDSHQCRTQ